MVVALIPARGGSKRIPKKNIKPFAGKPIIEYSIAAARACGVFDRVIVSTDSDEIASVARLAGAEVPFFRPEAISDDFATTADVVEHGIRWLEEKENASLSHLCCIYPTAPFVRVQDLKHGYELLTERKAPAVVPVSTFEYPIFRALKVNGTGGLEMIWPEHEAARSNDLPAAYHDAGQFYWLDVAAFKKTRRVWMPGTLPLVLPRHLVQDIDTLEDWEWAEKLYKNR